jgi:hypothetical protein
VASPLTLQDFQPEERLLKVVQRNGPITASKASDYIRNMSSGEASTLLDGMVRAGKLEVVDTTRKGSRKYGFPSTE